MENRSFLSFPIYAYTRTRALGFTAEGFLLNLAGLLTPGKRKSLPDLPVDLIPEVGARARELLIRDAERIAQGVISPRVLIPEHPRIHLQRLPALLMDSVGLGARRFKGRTTEFSKKAAELLDELPRYYRRNFHFQTDGYLSEDSGEIYEHQVEILFGGTADAMRRLLIPSLKEAYGDGRGTRFLEIGAGTGRMTRFIAQNFPKAQIVATDLSAPYLQVARRKLDPYSRVSFLQAAGEQLPFRDSGFDAVISCFLFHELPEEVRKNVLRESLRVLKPGGRIGLIDSLQKQDAEELSRIFELFPALFHEPYYRNYSETPMEDLAGGVFADHDWVDQKELGFLSKALWSRPLKVKQ